MLRLWPDQFVVQQRLTPEWSAKTIYAYGRHLGGSHTTPVRRKGYGKLRTLSYSVKEGSRYGCRCDEDGQRPGVLLQKNKEKIDLSFTDCSPRTIAWKAPGQAISFVMGHKTGSRKPGVPSCCIRSHRPDLLIRDITFT